MSSAAEHPDAELDAVGLYCPEPVMLLHQKVRTLAPGMVLKIKATDPSTERDIPKFCLFLGHELLAQAKAEGLFEYWIKIKSAA